MTINLRLFVVLGAILIIAGALSFAVRPRVAREAGLRRVINAGTLRATIFILFGVLAILVGTGAVPMLNWHDDSARRTTRTPR